MATLAIAAVLAGCGPVVPAGQPAPSTPAAAATSPGPTGSPSLPAISARPTPSGTSSASPVVAHDFEKAAPMTPEAPLKLLWQAGDPKAKNVMLWGPTVDPTGRIWVASSLEGRFWIFSPSGRLLEKWGTPGKGPGQFDFVDHSGGGDNGFGSIAFGPDGSFWVADTGNVRVDKFDASRRFVTSWGGFGTADGQFAKPIGIALDGRGDVFVTDDVRRDIQEFDANGSYIRTFAKGVAGPFFAVLDNGWVYTDILPDGTPGFTVYHPDGVLGGTLDLSNLVGFPTGIATDGEDHVYIAAETSAEPASPQALMELSAGNITHFWPTGGDGIALDPQHHAIYITFSSWPYLRKYELPAP